jgi:signal transduction histidine kinase
MGAGDGARPRSGLLHRIRQERARLGAVVLVAAVTITLLLVFRTYENRSQQAASRAAAAQLAASQIDALESMSRADGRLRPGGTAAAGQLLGEIKDNLSGLTSTGRAPQSMVEVYSSAVRAEFRALAAGRIATAQLINDRRVDPEYGRLSAQLRQVAARNAAATDTVATLSIFGQIISVAIGFAAAAALLLRFTAARDALAAAAVEQRLLRETDHAKSNLISVVSHDLRTPLTSITGYIEILLDGAAGPITAEQRRILAIMDRNSDKLLAIVSGLLFIARAQAGRLELALEKLNLEDAAAEAVESHEIQARQQGIDLRLSAAPAPSVMADRHRIGELIDNLLSNAIKFTPSGVINIAVRPADRQVRLEITDTGIGISPEDQGHLFEQFFRSANVTGIPGVGLGLAITKAIADAHQATISFHSTPGKGTTFCVEFPAPELLPTARQDPITSKTAAGTPNLSKPYAAQRQHAFLPGALQPPGRYFISPLLISESRSWPGWGCSKQLAEFPDERNLALRQIQGTGLIFPRCQGFARSEAGPRESI